MNESSDGETLIAAGIHGSRFVEQQRRKHDVQSWFLFWEHTERLRNEVNDWIGGN